MRKIFILLLIILLGSGGVFAEVLFTANTLGQGRFGLKTSYVGTTNNLSSLQNNTAYSFLLGYGIMPDLDIYGTAGYADYQNIGNLMPGSTVNGPQYGLTLKYRFLADSESAPLNLSGLFSYRANNLTSKMDLGGYGIYSNNTLIEDWGSGFILSKAFSTVVPYLATIYHVGSWMDSYGGLRLTNLELTGGLNLLFSESAGVILEYSNNSVTPQNASGPSFSMSNISFSLGYKL